MFVCSNVCQPGTQIIPLVHASKLVLPPTLLITPLGCVWINAPELQIFMGIIWYAIRLVHWPHILLRIQRGLVNRNVQLVHGLTHGHEGVWIFVRGFSMGSKIQILLIVFACTCVLRDSMAIGPIRPVWMSVPMAHTVKMVPTSVWVAALRIPMLITSSISALRIVQQAEMSMRMVLLTDASVFAQWSHPSTPKITDVYAWVYVKLIGTDWT